MDRLPESSWSRKLKMSRRKKKLEDPRLFGIAEGSWEPRIGSTMESQHRFNTSCPELDGTQKPVVNGNPSRPNNPVLRDLTLNIKAGETVALVGPSGGGKSSIVSLIENFYKPNDDYILLDGVPFKVALVAQEPILYNGSVRHATEDDVLNASKMANVHDFVMSLEKGYDTNCGEQGVQMSGGQKQRIAIDRALI